MSFSVGEQLFESVKRPDGPTPEDKLRPVHTYGIGAYGVFKASTVAKNFCNALHFRGPQIPVTVRFSNGLGCMAQHDSWSDPRGMATRFYLSEKGENEIATDLIAMTLPEYFTPTVDTFLAFAEMAKPTPYRRESSWRKIWDLLNLKIPQPDPNPGEIISPYEGAMAYAGLNDFSKYSIYQVSMIGAPVSYARAAYHAVHTFIVTGQDGTRRWVRFAWTPTVGVLPRDQNEKPQDHYLAHELRDRLSKGAVEFCLMMVIGEVGDDFADSSRPWGSQRQRVNMGTLTLQTVADDQITDCERLSFNPMRLIDGIEASDDPLLLARLQTYEASRTARDGASCPFSRS